MKSERAGMGKSLYVRRLAENLQQSLQKTEVAHVTISLHGPVITPDTVLELFQDHLQNPSCCIYHIDIARNVKFETHCSHMYLWPYLFSDSMESGYHSIQFADLTVCM